MLTPPPLSFSFVFFFFNDTATTEIYTLSLHDALPISCRLRSSSHWRRARVAARAPARSEEHTSELQSRENLVCRLLLEKKKNQISRSLFLSEKTRQTTIGARHNRT